MAGYGKLQRNWTPEGADHDEPVPKTPLGRRLQSLRQQIVRSGVPLLDWEDLDKELADRRGEERV
jgi:hypothetical protein